MFNRHKKLILSGLVTVWLGVSPVHALVENFSSDPFSTWSFGVGNNGNNQFVWNTNSAPVYTGDAIGSLTAHLNSSLPAARLQRPLGVWVTDTDSFSLSTRFSFDLISAPGEQFMQMAFGLVNDTQTGGDRTSGNVFQTVEFNYYPNVSTVFGGPVLTPAVFGAQKGGGTAFNNFASIFDSGSDLGDNSVGVTSLPQSVTLEAVLSYNGATKDLALGMFLVNGDGSLTPLITEVPSINLANPPLFSNYDTNFPFAVNSLAIMAYNDGFTSAGNPSLVADLTFQQFEFITSVPEPTSMTLLGLGLLVVAVRKRKA